MPPISLSPRQVQRQQPFGIVGYKPPKKDPFKFPSYAPGRLPGGGGFNIESVPDYQNRINQMLTVQAPQQPDGSGNWWDIGNDDGNYGDLIGGDWEVQDAETAMASRMAGLRGDFSAGIRRAMIDLGLTDITKAGNFGKYIDADTIKAATENKYSQMAQIKSQQEKANAMNEASRAARGGLYSGGTTNAAANVLASAEQARYSSLRDFLEGGEKGLRGLADEEYSLARGVAQARFAAAARAAELAGLRGKRTFPAGPGNVLGGTPFAGMTQDEMNEYYKWTRTMPGGDQYQLPSGWAPPSQGDLNAKLALKPERYWDGKKWVNY